MPQTSFPNDMPVAFEGMLADSGAIEVLTYDNGATAVPFGRFLVQGTGARDCALPSATGQKVIGVALHEHLEPDSSGVAQHVAYSAVPVLARGRVWVKTEQAVTPADPVYVRHTVGAGGTAVGQARKDADTSKADALARARFLTAASAGALVQVEINLP